MIVLNVIIGLIGVYLFLILVGLVFGGIGSLLDRGPNRRYRERIEGTPPSYEPLPEKWRVKGPDKDLPV